MSISRILCFLIFALITSSEATVSSGEASSEKGFKYFKTDGSWIESSYFDLNFIFLFEFYIFIHRYFLF